MEHLVKFGTSAAVSYPIYAYFYNGKILNSNMFGSVNLPIALSLMAGASYLVSDLAHEYIFPAMHVSEKFSAPVSSAMNIGVNYAGVYGMLELSAQGAGSAAGFQNLMLASAGSVVASHYVYQNYIGPLYGFHRSVY